MASMKGLMIAAFAACVCGASAEAGLFTRDWKELDQETVVRHFEKVAFLPYNGVPALSRIEPNQVIPWTNANISASVIEHHLAEIAALTGLEWRHVPHRSEAAFLVGVAPVDLINQVFEEMGLPPNNMDGKVCDGAFRHTNGLIFTGIVGIPDTVTDVEFRTCLIVEITQMMGLSRDIPVNFDTVTQAGYFTLSRLPEVDKLMLRILYDPRLKAGMTREEAMPIVRRILPEYWAKYGPPN